jgi:hypothetical protein
MCNVLTEDGAPVPTGTIDPELVKLGRKRVRVGALTALGMASLCVFFAVKLAPDRHFAGEPDKPRDATPAQILDGSLAMDSYVALHGEPLISHAIRAASSRGAPGERVVPVRGTGDRLWLVEPGDAFGPPAGEAYVGRLRPLGELPLAKAVREFLAEHPRPVFASAAELRRGFATGTIRTITGDDVHAAADTMVAFDVVDPSSAVIIGSFVQDVPDGPAWLAALGSAGIPVASSTTDRDSIRVEVHVDGAVASTTSKLDAAQLFAARVEPVTRHYQATWQTIAASPAGTFAVTGAAEASVPEDRVELAGIYAARDMPDGAYALITGEDPDDASYAWPVTIALGLFTLLFGWAFVIAVRRDWLSSDRG